MLHRIGTRVFTLAAVACWVLAGTANAGITVDIEWTGGGSETTAAASSTVTAEFFVTATGGTTIGGFQFSILWDAAELSYIDNPPIGPAPENDDSLNNTGPDFPRNGTWVNGGAGEFFLAVGSLSGAISTSTLTVETDSILPSDGKVSVGTIQFHVENGVVDDGAADISGCYDCATFAGDGSYGTGDITTTFNGAGINAPAVVVCGDGVAEGSEECDDGNANDTDFCSNSCIAAVCGDGVINGNDECDDGNTASGDGCDTSCNLEDVCGGDVTPPTIDSVTASPDVLWPPNHKLVSVSIAVSASDDCDAAPVCQIVSVASNEPVTGKGDKTAPDWNITGDLSLDLRAERAGKGDGRVYTATLECSDSLGHSSSEDVSVTVPHNQ